MSLETFQQDGDLLIGDTADTRDLMNVCTESVTDLTGQFCSLLDIQFLDAPLLEQRMAQIRYGGQDDLVPKCRQIFLDTVEDAFRL